MSNKVYGQFVTPNELLEKTKKIFAEEVDNFEVLEEHESTFEDVLDVTKMHSLSSYIASRGLDTTVIFSYEIDDQEFECQVDALIL